MRLIILNCILLLSLNVRGQEKTTRIYQTPYRYFVYPIEIVEAEFLMEKLDRNTEQNRERLNDIAPYIEPFGNKVTTIYPEDTAKYDRKEYRYILLCSEVEQYSKKVPVFCFYDRVENRWLDVPEKYSDKEYFESMIEFKEFVTKIMVDNQFTSRDIRSSALKDAVIAEEDERVQKIDRRKSVKRGGLWTLGAAGLTIVFLVVLNLILNAPI